MELRELVGGTVETIEPSETVVQAAARMEAGFVGSLAVVGGTGLEGIFTDRDVLRAVAASVDPAEATVSDWMTPYPDTFTPDMDVAEAAEWMLAVGYRHLPVVDSGELIGVASIKDILWAMSNEVPI